MMLPRSFNITFNECDIIQKKMTYLDVFNVFEDDRIVNLVILNKFNCNECLLLVVAHCIYYERLSF